jgi:CBS domain-containing protein
MTASQALTPATVGLSDTVQAVLQAKGGEIYSIDPAASVYEALQVMAVKEVGALVVLSEMRLEGILSERDYARKVILKGRSSHETEVREIMETPPVTAGPLDTVDDCMRRMTLNRVRHLPVVEDERVLGLISIGDLVKWIITAQGDTIRDLNNYIHGVYPS